MFDEMPHTNTNTVSYTVSECRVLVFEFEEKGSGEVVFDEMPDRKRE